MEHRIETPDGAVLHVEEDGEGPPLALVNGAFCSLRQWDHAIPDLAPSLRVIRHDVRGTGRSLSGSNDGYSFEQYAADLALVCDRLGAPRVLLWGMAWGARVALVAAALYPERVDRLVLSDLAIDPANPEAQKDGAKRARTAREAAGIPEIEPPAGWRDHLDTGTTRRALAATAAHPDLMPFAERVRAPVLVATGEHDPNLVSSRRAVGGFADARLEVLAHTGHGSVLQRPDLVVRKVFPFLREDS